MPPPSVPCPLAPHVPRRQQPADTASPGSAESAGVTGITHYAQTDRQTQHTFCLARPCSSCVRAPKALAASTNSPQWTEWIHCRLGRAWSARNCCNRGRCSSGWENSIEYWPADTTPTANHNASHNTCTKSHTANPPHTTQGHPPTT